VRFRFKRLSKLQYIANVLRLKLLSNSLYEVKAGLSLKRSRLPVGVSTCFSLKLLNIFQQDLVLSIYSKAVERNSFWSVLDLHNLSLTLSADHKVKHKAALGSLVHNAIQKHGGVDFKHGSLFKNGRCFPNEFFVILYARTSVTLTFIYCLCKFCNGTIQIYFSFIS
jgi:hypothetical protein